ncbi:hypothetical protein [Alteromonas macleodii]|uniref:hypothetical protein n=1 Tax=Alteromonas macleodii TaxID=28108 RepID=UPI00314035A4|tara:strand:+ start:18907 stop:19341 length:435 start_codon:yes stop_codon:yes gene_type:complete
MYESLKRQSNVLLGLASVKLFVAFLVLVFSIKVGGVGQIIMLVAGLACLITGWAAKNAGQAAQETSLSILRGEIQLMLNRSLVVKDELPNEVLSELPACLASYRELETSELVSRINDVSRVELEKAKSSLEQFYGKAVGYVSVV